MLEANFWAMQVWGLPSPPSLQAKTIGMMGLKGVPGLRVDRTPRSATSGGGEKGGAGRGKGAPSDQRRDYGSEFGRSQGAGGGRGGRGRRGGGRGRGKGRQR